jgi:cell division protein FtsQ
MAAVLRGEPRSRAKPRAQAKGRQPAPPKSSGKAPPRGPRGPKPPPLLDHGKLSAAASVNLPPRIALIVAAVVVTIGLVAGLATQNRGASLFGGGVAAVDRQLGAMGLKVRTLTIQGATPMAQPDIIRASQLYKDQPILGVDLEALRKQIEQVGWVKQASVVRLLPDTIVIAVTQRQTLAVWQHAGRAEVIDPDGHAIREADAGRFADLPLVVGEGANENAGSILPLIRARPRLLERLEALVRVDDRRWDLRMKDGSLIQLPATGEDSALIQLDALDQKSRILELGFARIDLRDPELVAVRPRDVAPPGQLVSGGA